MFTGYHPQPTEPVENDTHPAVPPAQPQPTLAKMHHHHMPRAWQIQHSSDDAQRQNASEQPLEQSSNFRSSDQIRYDQELQVLHQYVNQPKSALATPTSEAPFHLQESKKPLNGGAPRRPLSSPISTHDSHSVRDDSTSVGSGSRQPSFRTNYNRNPLDSDALCQTSGQRSRVRKACRRCRLKRRKCDEETPCWPCKDRDLTCDRSEAALEATKKATKNRVPTLQEIRNMFQESLRDFIDSTSSGARDEKRPRNRHDPEDSATWPEPTGSRLLPPPQLEDDHRTGAHHPIHSWPGLKLLLQKAQVKLDRAYVMEAEERPSLCLYPEDEEVAKCDGAQAGGFTGFVNYDGSIPGNALPTSTESYGYDASGGGVRPQHYGVEQRNFVDKAPLDAVAVEALYESYIRHIHSMQPFLDVDEVRGLLDDFIAWHGSLIQPSAAADRSDVTFDRPTKRRRHDDHSDIALLRRPGRRPRHLGHAVVYLILALGEICMHSDKLPANSPLIGRSATPSISLGYMYESSSLSLENDGTISRVSSQTPSADGGSHGNEGATTRRVPGLVYYEKAAEIFGGRSDGNSLTHAHIFLLAGLYKGQLARVKESMSWYTMAGRVLQQLVDSHKLIDSNHWVWTSGAGKALKERNQRFITDEHRSSIVRASYTCMMLEGDIQAYLDLPLSGITRLETMLPPPDTYLNADGRDEEPAQSTNILLHFTSQVYLRIVLNKFHKQLYSPSCERLSLAEIRCILQMQEETIDRWQKALPASMSWDLEDPPPTNILHARLRAKYWDARYLINRPFLDFILHTDLHSKFGVDEAESDSHREPQHGMEYHLFRVISDMGTEDVEFGYQTCIKAAEKSAIAFDNVHGRPIVTNVHGTAHAQFGNVLVLCDVYSRPNLRQLVDETELRHLLSRTISVLDEYAPVSPTCRLDCLTLKKIQSLIFGIPC